jgi:cytochrome P450
MDAYIREMKTNPAFNKPELIGLCTDFFEAGGETVGSTLSWVLLFLAQHPQVQRRCQREIKDNIGNYTMSSKYFK